MRAYILKMRTLYGFSDEGGAAKLKIREIEMEQNALVAKGQSGVDLHRAAELAEASSSVTKAHWYLQQYQAH